MEKKNIIQGENYRFTVLTDYLIRLEYSRSGIFIDQKTTIVQNRNIEKVKMTVKKSDDELQIITNKLHLYYKYGEFSSETLFIEMRANLSDFNNRWTFGNQVDTLKGTAQTLDGADGAIPLEEGIISKGGFTILDDSNSYLQLSNGEFKEKNEKSTDLYFFGYGRAYKKALKHYYKLTGSVPLVPRFALGNWWSRFWPYTEETYLKLMEKFKEKEIPLAVSVIDMDWHKRDIPERFGSGWTGYSWNKDYFPDPQGFLEKLHKMGLKTTLNVHPADGIRAFEDAYERISYRLKLNVLLEEPALFDFNSKEFRDAYFEEVHHPLEEEGVDFWWIDWQQGSHSGTKGVDPLWALNHYHYLDHEKRNGTGLILSRFAGPGSHRYPVGFSGDTIVSWDSLDFQPFFTATASNIGYSWWSHDIGGHMHGYKDEELALRWLQLGVFSPINRLHSSASPFNSKEPWVYALETEIAMSRMLRLRHALIPYLYTMNVRNHEEGIPLILPMYYYDSEDQRAYQNKNEYLFGSEMIVAPITQKTDDKLKLGKTKIWLPEGMWFDFFTGWQYQGNTELAIYRRKDEIPVFVKAGAIIPLDENPVYTRSDELPNEIVWKIFAGASNTFTLTEDLNKKRATTTVELDWDSKKVSLSTLDDHSIIPIKRKHNFEIIGTTAEIGIPEGHQEIIFNVERVEDELFRRLNQAEIEFELKEAIFNVFKAESVFSKRINALSNSVSGDFLQLLLELLYIENSSEL